MIDMNSICAHITDTQGWQNPPNRLPEQRLRGPLGAGPGGAKA